jgi:lipopolysaccharide biosynthesis glycosyltransferase
MTSRDQGASVDIVTSCDQRYLKPLAVMLVSLAEALGVDRRCRVHVLHVDLDDADQALVASCAASDAVEVVLHRVDPARLSSYPVTAALPMANYLRLEGPALIDADRLLHVDADVIFRRDPFELEARDLGGCTIGAVRDAAMPFVSWWRALPAWRSAGLDPLHPYFNGGVLLIDVEAWRRGRVAERFHEAIEREPPGRFHLQAPLNLVLAFDWHQLDLCWNAIDVCFDPSRAAPWREAAFPLDELQRAVDDPAIVHLTGSKPWDWGSTNPWTAAWLDVLDRTPFSGWRPRRRGGKVLEVLPDPIAERVARHARGLQRVWEERSPSVLQRGGTG